VWTKRGLAKGDPTILRELDADMQDAIVMLIISDHITNTKAPKARVQKCTEVLQTDRVAIVGPPHFEAISFH
jgi:hypothetical protein